jgi:hypothetical protein
VKNEGGDVRALGHGFLPLRTGEYASAGKMPDLDQFATATLSNVVGGDANDCRPLDLRAAEGSTFGCG